MLNIQEFREKFRVGNPERLLPSGLKSVELLKDVTDLLMINTLNEDSTASHEEALLRIYQRLRPGNPPNLDKASDLFPLSE